MNNPKINEPSQQPTAKERPIRVGVFASIAKADRAVERLVAAGFTKQQINVLCSNEAVERHFKEFEHQAPAGTHTPGSTLVGGTIGAVLGGLSVVAGAVATGGVALLATAPIAMWGGGAAGGLIGAMMTRGVERELANFYDQAVVKGRILVAVDLHEAPQPARLAEAARILAEEGAEPMSLPEG